MKKKKLKSFLSFLKNCGKIVNQPTKDKDLVFIEIDLPELTYIKRNKGLVKVEVILNPADHPEFYNLRESVSPIHIRLILEKYGLHPCRTSVSEILPKHQNATRSFDRTQSQGLDAEFHLLENYNQLSRKERKGNPLDAVFLKDSHCPCPYCRSTRKQSKSGH